MELKARIKDGQLQLLKNGSIIASAPAQEGHSVDSCEEVVGNVHFHASDEVLGRLRWLAEKRGPSVHALALRLVEQGLGRICMPCAGMGTDDNAVVCKVCQGAGANPSPALELQHKLRRYQLMAKAMGAQVTQRLDRIDEYERAAGNAICAACGLEYFDHPRGAMEFLTLLCNGTQVKL